MAKKRKATGRVASSGPKAFNPADGKLSINTYEDVADSEDEFHINRDKILLDDGPDAKRRRKFAEEDAFLEPSDEEVLGYSDESDDDGADDGHVEAKTNNNQDSEEERDGEDEDGEGWGSSKRDYYNADNIETEADALEEEAEAKRLQQKKLQKMSEADFGFDESEWLDAPNADEEGDTVTEVLKDIEITPDMEPRERLRILQTRYPEFEFLANEFVQLQPVLQDLQQQAEEELERTKSVLGNSTPTIAKARALAAYMAALTMYFALLTSPSKGPDGQSRTLDPVELRDHAVMDSLLQCRQLWSKVKLLRVRKESTASSEDGPLAILEVSQTNGNSEKIENVLKSTKKSRKEKTRSQASSDAAILRAERMQKAEDELADLTSLVPKSRKSAKRATKQIVADDDSDFGEEETMDARSAAEKASKKKSLRFYTSQIAQKANRRADAGRDAGGDADLPYRERLKDRQQRLNAEAEKRGKKLDEYGRGADLGGDDSGEEDTAIAQEVRDDEDEYYDMVAQSSKQKKADKDAKYEAIAAAKAEGKMVRVVEGEVGEDGKRAIGYVIEKNKGLAPSRKKDVRNPRVKKRKKYEEKKKKLSSTRAVYKGGEERGGYGGEKTGIKTGLVKSVKL
ncbi:sas10 utp3 family protein [Phlyctema vagabunda]|uniref:Sas10 utp3 family protein n=1 Tax=Phlyctema vagabunda TaxID=108571 RepID=A0ABR4PX27_9HELO